jgi:hypothetical protein
MTWPCYISDLTANLPIFTLLLPQQTLLSSVEPGGCPQCHLGAGYSFCLRLFPLEEAHGLLPHLLQVCIQIIFSQQDLHWPPQCSCFLWLKPSFLISIILSSYLSFPYPCHLLTYNWVHYRALFNLLSLYYIHLRIESAGEMRWGFSCFSLSVLFTVQAPRVASSE